MNSYIRLACLSSLSPSFLSSRSVVQYYSGTVFMYSTVLLYSYTPLLYYEYCMLYVQCTLLVPSTLEEEKYSTVYSITNKYGSLLGVLRIIP